MKDKIDRQLTSKRADILKVIKEAGKPVCVETIYMDMVNKNISINMSTVYRGIDFLVKKGYIRKLDFGEDNKSFFEEKIEGHYHYLRCLGCNEIIPLEDCPVKDYEKILSKKTNYVILGHKLEIVGYCSNCSKKL